MGRVLDVICYGLSVTREKWTRLHTQEGKDDHLTSDTPLKNEAQIKKLPRGPPFPLPSLFEPLDFRRVSIGW